MEEIRVMRVAYDALKPLRARERAGVLERVASALARGVAATQVAPDRVGPYEVWAQRLVLGEVELLEGKARGRVLRWLYAVSLRSQP